MTNLRIVTSHKHSKDPLGDTSDIELLHAISVDLIAEQDSLALYGKIVDAAISITRSQFGTMQVLRRDEDGAGSGLHLLTSRGLSPESVAFWEWVPSTALSSCTQALKLGRRAIIEDFETWPEIVGTSDLLAFRRAGIRSAQTTPLVSRDGTLLGMISTHWSDSHQPSERDLRLLDILARQAADLLERTMAEEALRERERALETSVAKLREMQVLQKLLFGRARPSRQELVRDGHGHYLPHFTGFKRSGTGANPTAAFDGSQFRKRHSSAVELESRALRRCSVGSCEERRCGGPHPH